MTDKRSGRGEKDTLVDRTPLDISRDQTRAARAPLPKMSVNLAGLPRKLDADGLIEADAVSITPQGRVPRLGRTKYVDAEELVEMVAQRVVQLLDERPCPHCKRSHEG